MLQRLYILLVCVCFCVLSSAQTFAQNPLDTRFNLLFGLNQPLVNGFNIEGNFFYKRLAFDYSHGVSLNFPNAFLTGDAAEQGLAVHLPYTTGFGIGYRFTEWLNLRLEPKWHRFEIYYDGDSQVPDNQIAAYNTFTLGLGLYGNLRPFKNLNNFLSGFMIAPSIRYWPNVATSLANNQFDYINRYSEGLERHKALAAGIANTPWVVNISVGYSFSLTPNP